MEFPEAIVHILAAEGGYVCHPDDPGGETRYGITKRVAQAHGYNGNMKILPLEKAMEIYKTAYWDACKCDELPPRIRLAVFDSAAHSGPSQAIRWLQQALGMKPIGRVSLSTINAAKDKDPALIVKELLDRRLRFLQGLKTWNTFKRGWTARIDKLLRLSQ